MSVAQRGVYTLCAPSAFVTAVTESLPIRTSHPSGSRHWGFPLRGRHPAPGCLQPRKFLGSLPWPSVADRSSSKPPGSDGRCLSIASGWQPCDPRSQIAGFCPWAGPTPCWFHGRGASVKTFRSTAIAVRYPLFKHMTSRRGLLDGYQFSFCRIAACTNRTTVAEQTMRCVAISRLL
jgi:hypothetical protein